ncbi:hypothetical protein J6590_094119 [Homalodisca vitripennis]|nr:hypothetical protein J6590_094119 [Homalodisca vitripennis]
MSRWHQQEYVNLNTEPWLTSSAGPGQLIKPNWKRLHRKLCLLRTLSKPDSKRKNGAALCCQQLVPIIDNGEQRHLKRLMQL